MLIPGGNYSGYVLSPLQAVSPGSSGTLTVHVQSLPTLNTLNWFVDAFLDDGVTFQQLGNGGGVLGSFAGSLTYPFTVPTNAHNVRVRLQIGGTANVGAEVN